MEWQACAQYYYLAPDIIFHPEDKLQGNNPVPIHIVQSGRRSLGKYMYRYVSLKHLQYLQCVIKSSYSAVLIKGGI